MARSSSPSRTRAVAYLRVSTEKQADKGVSLDAQRAKVTAYAELYDLELVEVIVDAGVSAKTLDRPGLGRALAMLRKGAADALLVVKLDRLTRAPFVTSGISCRAPFAPWPRCAPLGRRADRHALGGGPARAERARVGQPMGAGSHWRADFRRDAAQGERGRVHGRRGAVRLRARRRRRAPRPRRRRAGCDRDRGRAPAPAGLSLRAVAAELAARGHVSRAGRPFLAAQVARMTGKAAG